MQVTEGGVTRRVARAMEVLHASAPGARVRVMRAAYHSSAGPGAPASSYLMHSSRKVSPTSETKCTCFCSIHNSVINFVILTITGALVRI